MNLPREQAIAGHRELWNWIADMTELRKRKVDKGEYFEENGIKDKPFHSCYCCEYAYNGANYDFPHCSFCPINWTSQCEWYMCKDLYSPNDRNGFYQKWLREKDWQEAARLAREIANLPERRMR